ncbi:MAG: rRNA maturation RNase YbeY [Caldisericia bacterium]
MKKVEIFEKKNKIPYDKSFVKKIVKLILEKEKIDNYYISIAYLSKDDLREINKKYRQKDRTTNVLSFLYEKKDTFFGEIIISDYHIIVRKEDFIELLIHGILHLLGYDHTNKKEKEKMIKKEKFYYNFIKNEK